MNPDGDAPVIRTLPRNPFSWLPDARRRPTFLCAALLTLVLMAGLHVTNAPLQNPVAPLGMISLQLAGSLPAAKEILASWDARAQLSAALNLGIDYPYMVAYATTLGLACLLLVGRRGTPRWMVGLGVWLSWGMLLALSLDAVENGLLIRLLLGDLRESWAVLAFWCAVAKFVLVLAALVFLGVGGLVAVINVPSRHRSRH